MSSSAAAISGFGAKMSASRSALSMRSGSSMGIVSNMNMNLNMRGGASMRSNINIRINRINRSSNVMINRYAT
jgi:hypothetical protein